MRKTTDKPTEEGVYYVDLGDEYAVLVVEVSHGRLHCALYGRAEHWPDGVYYGPVSFEDVQFAERN